MRKAKSRHQSLAQMPILLEDVQVMGAGQQAVQKLRAD